MNTGDGESTAFATPRVTRRVVLAAAGAAAAGALLAACVDDGPHAERGGGPLEPEGIFVDVDVIDNSFRPDRIEIAPGTMVRWTNQGDVAHDITPVEASDWGVGPDVFVPNATYSHRFDEVGEVPYYCKIHGQPGFGMTGTIVVASTDPDGALPAEPGISTLTIG